MDRTRRQAALLARDNIRSQLGFYDGADDDSAANNRKRKHDDGDGDGDDVLYSDHSTKSAKRRPKQTLLQRKLRLKLAILNGLRSPSAIGRLGFPRPFSRDFNWFGNTPIPLSVWTSTLVWPLLRAVASAQLHAAVSRFCDAHTCRLIDDAKLITGLSEIDAAFESCTWLGDIVSAETINRVMDVFRAEAEKTGSESKALHGIVLTQRLDACRRATLLLRLRNAGEYAKAAKEAWRNMYAKAFSLKLRLQLPDLQRALLAIDPFITKLMLPTTIANVDAVIKQTLSIPRYVYDDSKIGSLSEHLMFKHIWGINPVWLADFITEKTLGYGTPVSDIPEFYPIDIGTGDEVVDVRKKHVLDNV